MGWTPIIDTATVDGTLQVRLHFTCNCIATGIDTGVLSQVLSQQPGIMSVADVSPDTLANIYNAFSLGFQNAYTVTVNPTAGAAIGTIRNSLYQAIQGAFGSMTIPCTQAAVGAIEISSTAIQEIENILTNPSTIGFGSIALVAVAIIAVVVFLEFGRRS